ncbi:twinfilin-like [Sitodiplosis mosellana]|uniref:twinfilin-like n=1 Tax=Sitodiplosis mosellana TaxID=263140 RepID=UPI0024452FB1|nr:twinfilin-like [Sitodiplosis mosellana]
MSHQTGIKANDELLKAFSKSKEGNTRVIKASIEKEQLTLAAEVEVNEDWEKDYKNLVEPLIEENTPCYIFFRLDSKSSIGYEWLLMSYTPDTATIRHKMLYASTKATMKKEFGSPHIKEEYHATSQRETTLFSFKKHKKAMSAPAPLTQREEEMLEIRRNEIQTDISTETRQKTLGGISCALTESAIVSIKDTVSGTYNYLQFKIDLKEEKIHLVKASNVEIEKLPKEVPEDEARYHVYLFKHTHEGDFLESYIFIYSMPGYKCPIKERMMYSSCKALFVEKIQELGLHIEKKLEIDSGSELTEEYFQDELHPKTLLHRPQFAKPQGPKNRGAKRLIGLRAPSEENNETA